MQTSNHRVGTPRRSEAMLDGASELVTVYLHSSDADGSASILTCNTEAESKTRRAIALEVAPR